MFCERLQPLGRRVKAQLLGRSIGARDHHGSVQTTPAAVESQKALLDTQNSLPRSSLGERRKRRKKNPACCTPTAGTHGPSTVIAPSIFSTAEFQVGRRRPSQSLHVDRPIN
jgi:hypothetical protein